MNLLIANDTSKYHSGCGKVMDFYHSHFKEHSLFLKNKPNLSDLENMDALVINGEGTMHDDAKKAKYLINLAHEIKKIKKIKIFLINTVWNNNSDELTKKLKNFDLISVRENKSKQEIVKIIGDNKNIILNLDLSYFSDVPYKKFVNSNVVAGNYYVKKSSKHGSKLIQGVGEDGHIDIFNQSWDDVVNKLRHSTLLITNRHHEMYAACKARCPFIAIEGNTHKNSGLIETFSVDIPVLPNGSDLVSIKDMISKIHLYKNNFEKLFDQMERFPSPNFLQWLQ